MKQATMIACLLLLLAGSAAAQLETEWIRTYGGASNDGFRSAIPAGDGGFVAVGYTYSYGPGDVNIFAVRTDAAGDTLWMRAFGGDGRDYAYGVCRALDGSYVIAGYTTSFGSGAEDVYVLKVDVSGNTLWSRTYGGAMPDEGRAVCAAPDGGVVVSGLTESYGSGRSDCYVLKIDAAGDTVWTRVTGGAEGDWAQGICLLGDGTYGVSGTTGSNSDNRDIYCLKFSDDGTMVWDGYYGDVGPINPDWGMGVCAVADTEMVLTGYRALEGRDPGELCLLRTDLDGAQLGYRKWADDFYEYGCDICRTPDLAYLMCGASKDDSTMLNDLLLVKKVDGLGWVWADTLGGPGSDWGSSIMQSDPGVYIISGHTSSSGAGGFDGWLLHMREPSAGVRGEDDLRQGALMPVPIPNPFSGATAIRCNLPRPATLTLAVYDVTGRRVALLAEGPHQAGTLSLAWDGRDDNGRKLSPGVYVASLVAGEASTSRKLVLLK